MSGIGELVVVVVLVVLVGGVEAMVAAGWSVAGVWGRGRVCVLFQAEGGRGLR